MNAEETLDYTLGCLDAQELEEFERLIQTDPALAERSERLSMALQRLLDDGAEHEPPQGLADRTIGFVAQARSLKVHRHSDQPSFRSTIRWADVAVAASIFIVGLLTILPLLQYARDRRNHFACVNNLQLFGQKLTQYASAHSSYPFSPGERIDDPAGTYAVVLHDEGLLPDFELLDCPYNGPGNDSLKQLPKYDDLGTLRRTDPERFRKLASLSDYAFHVGYRHPTGKVGPLECRHSGSIPLIADKPDHDANHTVIPGNSPNHGRRGQNVLFSDGAVKWLQTRFVSAQDPDLFLNNEQLPGPGTHAQDSVLLPSSPAPAR